MFHNLLKLNNAKWHRIKTLRQQIMRTDLQKKSPSQEMRNMDNGYEIRDLMKMLKNLYLEKGISDRFVFYGKVVGIGK